MSSKTCMKSHTFRWRVQCSVNGVGARTLHPGECSVRRWCGCLRCTPDIGVAPQSIRRTECVAAIAPPRTTATATSTRSRRRGIVMNSGKDEAKEGT